VKKQKAGSVIIVDEDEDCEKCEGVESLNGNPPASGKTSKKALLSTGNKSVSASLDPFRDVYMLCYVKVDKFLEVRSSVLVVPEKLRERINDSNEVFLRSVNDFDAKNTALRALVNERRVLYNSLKLLPVDPAPDKFHLLPTEWLKQWISGEVYRPVRQQNDIEADPVQVTIDLTESPDDVEISGIDVNQISREFLVPPTSLKAFSLQACKHNNGIPANFISSFKVVSKEAYEEIINSLGITSLPEKSDCFNRFDSTNYQCMECSSDSESAINTRKKQAGSLQRISQQIETDTQQSSDLTDKPYALSKKWITDLKRCCNSASNIESSSSKSKIRSSVFDIGQLSRVNIDLRCKHNFLACGAKVVKITEDTWKSICDEFSADGILPIEVKSGETICDLCNAEINNKRIEIEKSNLVKKSELSRRSLRDLLSNLDPVPSHFFTDLSSATRSINFLEPLVYQRPHYLVSRDWLDSWRRYHNSDDNVQRPNSLLNSQLQCDCDSKLVLFSDEFFHLPNGQVHLGIQSIENDGIPNAQLVTEDEWNSLVDCYGPVAIDEWQGGDDEKHLNELFIVKLQNINGTLKWNPERCEECYTKRMQVFVERIETWEGEASHFSVAVLGAADAVPGSSTSLSDGGIAIKKRPTRKNRNQTPLQLFIGCAQNSLISTLKWNICEALNKQNGMQVLPNAMVRQK
jgi:hypothetical protein